MTAMSTKHGMYGTPVYSSWRSMMDRCTNPNSHAYIHYGARGITVSKRWHKFENFYADMGEPNGLSIERVNNELGYSPENCEWASAKTQANNKRTSVSLTYQGVTKTISQWAEHLNVPRTRLYERAEAGWPVDRILTTPKGPTGPKGKSC
jgi:hypothetical protein